VPPYDPFSASDKHNYRIYSQIVGKPESYVFGFLRDVRSLDGKFPDGRFTRLLSPDEERMMEGFEGDAFRLYLSVLPDCMRTRINTHLTTYPGFGSTGRFFTLDARHGEGELRICREDAISKTMQRLIPDFGSIFVPRKRGCKLVYNCNGPRK